MAKLEAMGADAALPSAPGVPGSEQLTFMRRLAALFGAWLLVCAVVTLGFPGDASDASYVLVVVAGMFLPVAAFLVAYRRSAALRARVLSLDFSAITAIQFCRVAGIAFLVLWAVDEMAPAVALWIGGIDVFIGLTSMFAAYLLVAQRPFPRATLRSWNVLGLLSLVVGIPLAVMLTSSSLGVLNASPTADRVFEFPLALITMGGAGVAMTLHTICLLQLRGCRAPQAGPLFSGSRRVG